MTNKEPFSITEIQNWMQAMLVQHIPVSQSGIVTADMVNDSQRLNATQHLSIYRQSYIARLRDCMKNQFKCLAFALGDSLFEAFADQYLDSNPSTSYTLNDLGEQFSAFLKETRPDAESDEKEDWPDFMIELADFEYALSIIFDMEERHKMTIPKDETPDHLLIASPTLHLFEHQFPICRYYIDFSADRSPELPLLQQSFCSVSRQNFRLGLHPLGQDQFYFLKCLKAGDSIDEAANKLISFFIFERNNFDKVWPIWRKNFIASGFLTSK